jgi:hypothetical protein
VFKAKKDNLSRRSATRETETLPDLIEEEPPVGVNHPGMKKRRVLAETKDPPTEIKKTSVGLPRDAGLTIPPTRDINAATNRRVIGRIDSKKMKRPLSG